VELEVLGAEKRLKLEPSAEGSEQTPPRRVDVTLSQARAVRHEVLEGERDRRPGARPEDRGDGLDEGGAHEDVGAPGVEARNLLETREQLEEMSAMGHRRE